MHEAILLSLKDSDALMIPISWTADQVAQLKSQLGSFGVHIADGNIQQADVPEIVVVRKA
jgi:hypothetical protein